MQKRLLTLSMLVLLLFSVALTAAQEPVEIRFMFYQDGTEADVMRDLVNRFNEENSDVNVVLDVVPYDTIINTLPNAVETGEAPDIARITAFAQMAGDYLDLRPLLSDPAMMEDNFNGAILAAFRDPANPDDDGLYGFPDQYTLTIPYINRTLFELAEVEIPEGVTTWDEWSALVAQVAETNELEYGIAVDPRIHRVSGPAISYGADIFDDEGNFTIDSEGFRSFLEIMKGWVDDGLMPSETWAGDVFPNEAFTSGNLVMIMSGTWNIAQFDETIGDLFDWSAVASPAGPDGEHGTSIPGGAAIVAFEQTEHPEEVARFMEYLMQPDVYKEYVERSLFVPAHEGVSAAGGLNYETDSENVANTFAVLSGEAPFITDDAANLNLHPFARVYYSQGNQRVAQYLTGELTLDEAIAALQQDIDDAIANADVSS